MHAEDICHEQRPTLWEVPIARTLDDGHSVPENVVAASFGHSAEEVAAALLVGSEAPRDDDLEPAAEVQGQELRRVVQRLAGASMWNRAGPAATAVAKPGVEAGPPEIAKNSALTENEVAESYGEGEVGSSWSRTTCTTSTDEMAADAKSVVEARPSGIAKQSATTESVVAESSGKAGSSGSRADG